MAYDAFYWRDAIPRSKEAYKNWCVFCPQDIKHYYDERKDATNIDV